MNTTTTGHAVRTYRTALGWDQLTLADRAGIARDTLSRIENGQNPTMTTVKKLADALGIEPGQLVA